MTAIGSTGKEEALVSRDWNWAAIGQLDVWKGNKGYRQLNFFSLKINSS